MRSFTWTVPQMTRLVPGSIVTRHSNGDQETHVVLKSPEVDFDWVGGWRVHLELEDSCFTSSITELDPESVVPPSEQLEGNDLVRYAATIRLERDLLRGQVQNVRRELIEMIIRDLEPLELDTLVEKYESLLD
jgi:hypothetical protein